MIQLEARGTAIEQKIKQLSNVIIEPVTIVAGLNLKPVILSQNKEIVELFDKFLLEQVNGEINSIQFIDTIATKGVFDYNGWRIIKRSSSDYQLNRSVYECLAVKMIEKTSTG
jgi:hypothetical protein